MRSIQYLALLLILSLAINHVYGAPGKKAGSEEEGGEGGEGGGEEEEEGGEGGEGGEGDPEHERKQIAGELIRIERKLDLDIETNDHYDIRYALVDLETRIRPRVARLSKDIDATLTNPDQKAGEDKFQRGLLEDITRILFKAGARSCLSPHETFYVPSKKCMKFGPSARVNPCAEKKDQVLYDGKNNEGICDCIEDERHLIYYDGECYQQNYQGPCLKNFWLVMHNGTISCEPIPANCVADGQHVNWSPNPEAVPADCHQLGKRGPCSIDQVVSRDAAGIISCVVSNEPIALKAVAAKIAKVAGRNSTATRNAKPISDLATDLNNNSTTAAVETTSSPVPQKKKEFKKATASVVEEKPSSMWDQQSCSLGSYRKQSGKCPPY
ncbi:Uncharacterized protein APZ42_017213 [Daphnia magna]|uniref:Uncharacterized protein n=2 Tax=Daphnia magna TaxID=35525 RepID=A0A164ZRB3_9CRUS|nr:hypothetical protein OUZ56_015557 [Daphnia magna]KZS16655.1 Uncharacterized protein APZ42_017213 [Daphnia magna]